MMERRKVEERFPRWYPMLKKEQGLFIETMENLDAELLIEFMQNSHDGIFVVDSKGKLIVANPSVIDMLGFAYEELVGQYVGDMLKHGVYSGSPSTEAAKTGKLHTGLVRTRNGNEIMSTSNPVFDEKGNLKYVITNCRPFKLIKEFCETHIGKEVILSSSDNDEDIEETKFISNSETMRAITEDMLYAAQTKCPILLLGQTGTGKGMLAEYIHKSSQRRNNKFIEINCAAIPENLLEAELFGYEKGAFTGASEGGKLGLLEIADNGTVFLDEIGELPLQMQTKLLKVLDSGYIRRLGGTVDHRVNIRIISATNRDLTKMIADRTFREDLYYRLNVISVKIPQLKERKSEIPVMAEYYIARFNKKYSVDKTISEEALNLLSESDWPGNIRQLRNFIERLVIMSKGQNIIQEELVNKLFIQDGTVRENTLTDCRESVDKSQKTVNGIWSQNETLKEYMDRIEKEYIRDCIRQSDGSITKAAEKLGIHRTAIYKKLADDVSK